MDEHDAIERIRQAKVAMIQAAHYLGREWARGVEFDLHERADLAFEAVAPRAGEQLLNGQARSEPVDDPFFVIFPDHDGNRHASESFWKSALGDPSPPRFLVDAFLEGAARFHREVDIDALGG